MCASTATLCKGQKFLWGCICLAAECNKHILGVTIKSKLGSVAFYSWIYIPWNNNFKKTLKLIERYVLIWQLTEMAVEDIIIDNRWQYNFDLSIFNHFLHCILQTIQRCLKLGSKMCVPQICSCGHSAGMVSALDTCMECCMNDKAAKELARLRQMQIMTGNCLME